MPGSRAHAKPEDLSVMLVSTILNTVNMWRRNILLILFDPILLITVNVEIGKPGSDPTDYSECFRLLRAVLLITVNVHGSPPTKSTDYSECL